VIAVLLAFSQNVRRQEKKVKIVYGNVVLKREKLLRGLSEEKFILSFCPPEYFLSNEKLSATMPANVPRLKKVRLWKTYLSALRNVR
jgi:hypothetical protein